MSQFCLYVGIATLLTVVDGVSQPNSCADIYKTDKFSKNGTYVIYNRQHQSYNVYCEFHYGFGYTYVDLTTTSAINIADLYTNASYVLIRDLRADGHQYVSRVEQMAAYEQYNLSLQFNSHVGYAPPVNDKMSPYLYVGFIPSNIANRVGAVQGYRVNGADYSFVNCDANPNSYFVFLKNANHVATANYNPMPSPLVQRWDTTAKPVHNSNYLPSSYFTFFELHFGGCGGFATAATFPSITGAALGLRYDITCPEPPSIANGSKTGGGTAVESVVHYTCNIGYTKLNGDEVRTCLENGQYTGISPVCGKLPCDSMPCQNGGTCFADGNMYVCECREGYDGQNCEQRMGK